MTNIKIIDQSKVRNKIEYVEGQCFLNENNIYVLTCIGNDYVLVNYDGVYWDDPGTLEDVNNQIEEDGDFKPISEMEIFIRG